MTQSSAIILALFTAAVLLASSEAYRRPQHSHSQYKPLGDESESNMARQYASPAFYGRPSMQMQRDPGQKEDLLHRAQRNAESLNSIFADELAYREAYARQFGRKG